jgi:hypothetical protein
MPSPRFDFVMALFVLLFFYVEGAAAWGLGSTIALLMGTWRSCGCLLKRILPQVLQSPSC